MRSWTAFQRERVAIAEAVADAMISEFGVEAYREARIRKRDATTNDLTAHWKRVALAITRKIRKPDRVDTVTRKPMDAKFSNSRQPSQHPDLSPAGRPDR